MFERNKCVLCNDMDLIYINELDYPVNDCINKDEINPIIKLKYGYCNYCYSVQLMNLLDPKILYDNNYFQPLFINYNWIQHNISFINFIIYSIDINEPIIEIGSSSFCIGKHLIHYYKDYTVFDIVLNKNINRLDNIKYIEANCEEYNFNENSNIIMSHVFEHLYNPKLFIKNCKKNKVKNIIIAIPDMNNILTNHVGNQHTFLYSDSDIIYIFNEYNYRLNNKYNFIANDNSFPCLFFHFSYYKNKIDYNRIIINNRHISTINMFNKINIPNNTFIATAGMGANLLYSRINNKKNIIGIIDKNKLKKGKLFSYSNLIINDYDYLKNYNYDTNILVFGPHKNNIINDIKLINNNINIIDISTLN